MKPIITYLLLLPFLLFSSVSLKATAGGSAGGEDPAGLAAGTGGGSKDSVSGGFEVPAKKGDKKFCAGGKLLPEFWVIACGFLNLRDQVAWAFCSRECNRASRHSRTTIDPNYVVEEVDKLIAEAKIEKAYQLLSLYINVSPQQKIAPQLLNRFILIMHSELWPNNKFAPLRTEIFEFLKQRALEELELFARANNINRELYNTMQSTLQKLNLGNEKVNGIVIGDKFLNIKIPEELLVLINDFCKEGSTAAEKAFKAASAVGEAAPVAAGQTCCLRENAALTSQIQSNISGQATALLAYILYKDGKLENAVEVINQANMYNKRSVLVHWVSGVLEHYHFKQPFQGLLSYLKAIKYDPDFAYSNYSLAVLLADMGKADIARAFYQRCLELDPNHHYARMNRAIAMGDDDVSILDLYRKNIEIHPTEIYNYREVARILLRRHRQQAAAGGDPDQVAEAERLLKKAIEIDVKGGGAGHFLDLGFLYLRERNDIEKAIENFLQFIMHAENRDLAGRTNILVQQLRLGGGAPPEAEEGHPSGDDDYDYSDEEGDDLSDEFTDAD